MNPEVAAIFASYPLAVADCLIAIRELIYQVAAKTPGVGTLEETLKWGEPAYLTSETKSGTTIRLALKKPDQCAILVNCKTTLIDGFRERYGDQLNYEGTRAIVFEPASPPSDDILCECIAAALTYRRK